MATLYTIATEIYADLEGGDIPDYEKFPLPYLYEKIRNNRITTFLEYLVANKFREVPDEWCMTYRPTYTYSQQDNIGAYAAFSIPLIATLPRNLGLVDVSSTDTTHSLMIETSLENIRTMINGIVFKSLARRYGIAYQSGEVLRCYGNTGLRNITMNFVPADPTEVPIYTYVKASNSYTSRAFDETIDNYPISDVLLPRLKALVKADLGYAIQKSFDINTDKSDVQRQQIQQPTQ